MENTSNRPAFGDGPATYGVISKINHWVIAITMIGMLLSGLVMAYGPFEREVVGAIRDWHKPVGVLVLGYGLWRIFWRVMQGLPRPASIMPRWQTVIAKLTHLGLLATVLVMPLSGIIMSVFNGRDVIAFGMTIPAQEKVEWIAAAGRGAHEYASFALIALLVLHIGGALKHHFINRDATLRRMM